MKNKEKFIETHLAFILTTLITYVLSIIFAFVEFGEHGGNCAEILLDTVAPTTITYVLGCVMVNIADLLQRNESSHYLCNIFTCFFIFVYALLFVVYISSSFTILWFIGGFIATAILLYCNVRCYKEKFMNRNHGLV